MSSMTIRRVDFGYFVRPAEETGTGASRVEPCLGYLIDHPDGRILMDTGMGIHPEVDAHYRPHRKLLSLALGEVGTRIEDIRIVVNCHLHFDHCGGNPEMTGKPIVVQTAELQAAQRIVDYTLPELVDAPGLRYEELNGEAEILSGVLVVPTPGHTDGHQSLIAQLDDGTVVVAGQSHDIASAYSADVLTIRARQEQHDAVLPIAPAWIDRLRALDPRRVVFAHDYAIWEP